MTFTVACQLPSRNRADETQVLNFSIWKHFITENNMSGQWEVVGKKKDKASKIPQQVKKDDGKRKPNAAVTKVEDVLPMSQVKNLYKAGKVNNKENQNPREKTQQHENGMKKPQKKQAEQPKPKPPKSIESALNAIVVDDFRELFDRCKLNFPDTPVVWLKELSQFLNQRLSLDVPDSTFKSKPEGYPLSVVPTALKDLIVKSVKEVGKSNSSLFFDISLTSMATDMSKGLPALGHKLYLQCIASNDPKSVTTNLGKTNVLRTSYQNRPPIGLSILWVLAQAGLKDAQAALKVFEELMLPLIEMKNYSRYITEYLIKIVEEHSTASLNKEQYSLLLDVICGERKNVPADLAKGLNKLHPTLNARLLADIGDQKLHLIFESLLKKLGHVGSNEQYRKCLCEVLAICVQRDVRSFGVWNKCYAKYVTPSSVLLSYLDTNWGAVKKDVDRTAFSEFLSSVEAASAELLGKKRKDPNVVATVKVIQGLRYKMAAKKDKSFISRIFQLLLFTFILTAILQVYYDTVVIGWEFSGTRKLCTWLGFRECADQVIATAVKKFEFYKTALHDLYPEIEEPLLKVCDYLRPYFRLAIDLSITFINILSGFTDFVVYQLVQLRSVFEKYAPGFVDQSEKTVGEIWATSVMYVESGVYYLKNEVFVGQLSPENMQKVVIDVLNATQQKATEYYLWVYEKVQTSIK